MQSFAVINTEFGKTTLKRCQEHGSRTSFINWRNSMAKTPRTADKRMASLTRLFSWAVDKEIMARNPVARPKRLYKGHRAEKIWSPHDHQAFEFVASRVLLDAKLLADETGQRQGDLLALKWSAYDGQRLRFTQSKTKAKVSILCADHLKKRLDELKRINQEREQPTLTILTTQHGKPWQSGFGASWGKAKRKAGLVDRTFHDLRGSFVVRCIASGLTLEQIAQVTGHSMDDLRTLERYYMGRNEAIADSVILTINGVGT
ncbi:tyrosine-type recombinase/integrase [Ahrensia marina]|uniref:tyrosine-type recombinase/integrase n=1 Tax=Ahrensia marina TaxID=1514904 RepID=UPI0035D0F847